MGQWFATKNFNVVARKLLSVSVLGLLSTITALLFVLRAFTIFNYTASIFCKWRNFLLLREVVLFTLLPGLRFVE